MKYPFGQANHQTPSYLHSYYVMHSMNFLLRLFSLLMLTLFISDKVHAQEVKSDSLLLQRPVEITNGKALTPLLPQISEIETLRHGPTGKDSLTLPIQRLLPNNQPYLPYPVNPSPLYKGDFTTSGAVYRYRLGQIWLQGEQNTLPGSGRINEAAALWSHTFNDRLRREAAVISTQLNLAFFHRHALQLNGQMHYRLNDRLSLNLFGSYDTGNPYNLYGRQWGGTLDWQIAPRFGIEGGVRRSFDAVTGRWETLPIVAPYYNINSKLHLQIDIGPLIHKLLRDANYGREGRGNPTIAPPKNHIELR